MKNKRMIVFLLACFLITWGFVVYSIISTTKQPSYSDEFDFKKLEVIQEERSTIETFTLYLEYRDPFIDKPIKRKVSAAKPKKTKKKPEKKIPPSIDWSFISYAGMVEQQTTSVKVAICVIRGKKYILAAGDSALKVSLLQVYPDSIQVAFLDQKITIIKSGL